MLAMTLCSSDNPEDKLRFCFKSLDLDNNGWLDREEVTYAVELIFKHNPGLENKVAADVNTPQKVSPSFSFPPFSFLFFCFPLIGNFL